MQIYCAGAIDHLRCLVCDRRSKQPMTTTSFGDEGNETAARQIRLLDKEPLGSYLSLGVSVEQCHFHVRFHKDPWRGRRDANEKSRVFPHGSFIASLGRTRLDAGRDFHFRGRLDLRRRIVRGCWVTSFSRCATKETAKSNRQKTNELLHRVLLKQLEDQRGDWDEKCSRPKPSWYENQSGLKSLIPSLLITTFTTTRQVADYAGQAVLIDRAEFKPEWNA